MAQCTVVMAYRKRMKHRGYSDIHITELKDRPGWFRVQAVEPAAGVPICAEVDFRTMPSRVR